MRPVRFITILTITSLLPLVAKSANGEPANIALSDDELSLCITDSRQKTVSIKKVIQQLVGGDSIDSRCFTTLKAEKFYENLDALYFEANSADKSYRESSSPFLEPNIEFGSTVINAQTGSNTKNITGKKPTHFKVPNYSVIYGTE